MNTTINGKVVLWGCQNVLNDAIDCCEQYGEVDYNDDTETLVLILEEEWEQEWQDKGIELVSELHKNIPDVTILLSYTIQDHDSERSKIFECQYKNECCRYRDTDWFYDELSDSDMTYDEFEEEGHVDMSEDMFEEYVHHHDEFERKDFSEWECVDWD